MNHRVDASESLELLGDQESDGDQALSIISRRDNHPPKLLTLVTIGLLAFFLLDVVAFFFIARLLLDTKESIQAFENLEFKNPYVGLDALYGSQKINASHYAPLVNEPRLAVQVSPAYPNKVFPIDAHRWLSDFGLLSPPDRRFKVSNNKEAPVHTIVQFNVLDYGMEYCSLIIRLPRRENTLPHPFTVPTTSNAVPLRICEVAAERPLKQSLISWSTRPSCLRDLGIVKARIGDEVELERFVCKIGTFLGYQISCADSSLQCDIDVWTNQNETWGIFIKQYQSIV
ncbi:hypothetical protein BDN70DRAFT_863897 [Pholiota conissans]|uniref:Ubiquitin 3 binding protein But2 C-terminal domain-containing protein n=1 Tax=Pholiota conissans TaxID=109636 RepID=A0A9P5YUI1_9AGAR|nr:hypothetical protein BDN70DRAFT_863897 [Pholiota conissans]